MVYRAVSSYGTEDHGVLEAREILIGPNKLLISYNESTGNIMFPDSIVGSLSLGGDLSITGNLILGGNIIGDGNTVLVSNVSALNADGVSVSNAIVGDITFDDVVSVLGTLVASDVETPGNANFGGITGTPLMTAGDLYVLDDLNSVSGTVSVSGTYTVLDRFLAGTSASVTGTVTVTGNVDTTAESSNFVARGTNANVSGDITIIGGSQTLTSNGLANIQGTLSVSRDVSVPTLTVSGTATANNATGSIVFNGNLQTGTLVSDSVSIAGGNTTADQLLLGDFEITGNLTIDPGYLGTEVIGTSGGNINVSGNLDVQDVLVSSFEDSGTTAITGNLAAGTDFNIGGQLTAVSMRSSGNLDVTGNVSTSTLTSLLSVSASTVLIPNFVAASGASLAAVSSNGTMTIDSALSTGTLLVPTSFSMGDATFSGTLETGAFSSNTMDVSGNVSLGAGTAASFEFNAGNVSGVTGTTTIDDLVVSGLTSVASLVSGDVSVSGNVSASTAALSGTLTADLVTGTELNADPLSGTATAGNAVISILMDSADLSATTSASAASLNAGGVGSQIGNISVSGTSNIGNVDATTLGMTIAGSIQANSGNIAGNLTFDSATAEAIDSSAVFSTGNLVATETSNNTMTLSAADITLTDGNLTVSGTSAFTDLEANAGITLTGVLSYAGDVSVSGFANVSGAMAITGNLTVSNAIVAGTIAAGDATVNSVIGSPNFDVTGIFEAASLTVTTLDIGSNLAVSGNLKIDGNLTVSGNLTASGNLEVLDLADTAQGKETTMNGVISVPHKIVAPGHWIIGNIDEYSYTGTSDYRPIDNVISQARGFTISGNNYVCNSGGLHLVVTHAYYSTFAGTYLDQGIRQDGTTYVYNKARLNDSYNKEIRSIAAYMFEFSDGTNIDIGTVLSSDTHTASSSDANLAVKNYILQLHLNIGVVYGRYTTSGTTTASTSDFKVLLDTVDYDPTEDSLLASNTVTIPKTSWYIVTASLTFDTSSFGYDDTGIAYIRAVAPSGAVRKLGYRATWLQHTTTDSAVTCFDIAVLEEGETLQLYSKMEQSTGTVQDGSLAFCEYGPSLGRSEYAILRLDNDVPVASGSDVTISFDTLVNSTGKITTGSSVTIVNPGMHIAYLYVYYYNDVVDGPPETIGVGVARNGTVMAREQHSCYLDTDYGLSMVCMFYAEAGDVITGITYLSESGTITHPSSSGETGDTEIGVARIGY